MLQGHLLPSLVLNDYDFHDPHGHCGLNGHRGHRDLNGHCDHRDLNGHHDHRVLNGHHDHRVLNGHHDHRVLNGHHLEQGRLVDVQFFQHIFLILMLESRNSLNYNFLAEHHLIQYINH